MRIRQETMNLIFLLSVSLLIACDISTNPDDEPPCQGIFEDPAFSNPSDEQANIPMAIIDFARQVIIGTTGKEFFEQYIRYSPYHSRAHKADTTYRVNFILEIADKPFVRELIGVTIGESGVPLKEELPLPHCRNQPGECQFPIDEAQAKQIAQEMGLAAGIGEWQSSFHWHYGYDTFVWGIFNLMSYSEDSCSGHDILIDANSGEFLEKGEWSYIID